MPTKTELQKKINELEEKNEELEDKLDLALNWGNAYIKFVREIGLEDIFVEAVKTNSPIILEEIKEKVNKLK